MFPKFRRTKYFWPVPPAPRFPDPRLSRVNPMSGNKYLIKVLWHGINDTTFPMTRHSDKMTRDSRHGIIYFWKFSMKSFNQWVWGQGIKIWKNPYMGTSRDLNIINAKCNNLEIDNFDDDELNEILYYVCSSWFHFTILTSYHIYIGNFIDPP